MLHHPPRSCFRASHQTFVVLIIHSTKLFQRLVQLAFFEVRQSEIHFQSRVVGVEFDGLVVEAGRFFEISFFVSFFCLVGFPRNLSGIGSTRNSSQGDHPADQPPPKIACGFCNQSHATTSPGPLRRRRVVLVANISIINKAMAGPRNHWNLSV